MTDKSSDSSGRDLKNADLPEDLLERFQAYVCEMFRGGEDDVRRYRHRMRKSYRLFRANHLDPARPIVRGGVLCESAVEFLKDATCFAKADSILEQFESVYNEVDDIDPSCIDLSDTKIVSLLQYFMKEEIAACKEKAAELEELLKIPET